MKIRAYYIVLVSIFNLLFSITSADQNNQDIQTDNGEMGIYFCTRDVDEFRSSAIPSDKSVHGHKEDFIVVDDHDSSNHKHLRHCFILLAEEIPTPEVNKEGKLVLRLGTYSRGYYPSIEGNSKGVLRGEEPWLYDQEKRNERTVSCTPILKEENIEKIAQSILEDKNGHCINKPWNFDLNNMSPEYDASTTPNKKDILTFVFFNIINEMERLGGKYGPVTYNCCTVAFQSLREAKKGAKNWNNWGYSYEIDISNINKRDFNVLGTGIARGEDDSVTGYIWGVERLIEDIIRSGYRTIV